MKARNCCVIFIVILFFEGCKKFVQIGHPTTELVTSSVFSGNASATAAQTTIYSLMANNNESGNMAVNLGLLSDELVNYNTLAPEYVQFYTNSMTAASGLGPWDNVYNYIFQANAIISGIQASSEISPGVAQQLLGEARFVRAFWYFYLTNLYGDVPLALSTDFSTNSVLKRTSQTVVYQQIVNDLKSAKELLNVNYVDASDTTATTSDRSRPNKSASSALLARVYLYLGDYTDAENETDSIIGNNGLYTLCTNLDNVFLVNSPEAIWQLAIPLPNTLNTLDGYYFILLSEPGPSSYNCCALSSQLLNGFESGDLRRVNWVDSFVTASASPVIYYYPYKYKIYTGSDITEDVMVLRLAEQYLIRSEARAEQGNLVGAVNDLNVIRNRAGLPNYSGGMDKISVIASVLHERQIEFFAEWGHRWLDLIRTGAADTILGAPGNITQLKSSGRNTWSHNDKLFPIPESEIIINENLTQNPGY